jgi:hypothetical protein
VQEDELLRLDLLLLQSGQPNIELSDELAGVMPQLVHLGG